MDFAASPVTHHASMPTRTLDVLGGEWVSRTIDLPPDEEGDVVATLVSAADGPQHDGAVLYIHGFVDYFFQAEHARRWIEHGYDFYGLDLRKYGRSIRPHQSPNDVHDLRTYGAEIAEALRIIRAEHGADVRVVLLGHSTGGLIASLWAHAHPGAIDALVLNSPWFDHNGPWTERVALTKVADVVGRVTPGLAIGSLSPFYGRALHVDTGGRWDYDLTWKPHDGFPIRAGFFRTIRRGHARVARGLAIDVPVLVCVSARSGPAHSESPALADSDCVLDVAQMVARAPGLGPDVTIVQVDGGIHDLALSAPVARETYEAAVFDWLERQSPRTP